MNMPKLLRIFLFLLSFCLCENASVWAQEEGRKLYEGQFAPPFSVKDIDGRFHSIEQYKGKKVLISFFRNAGCPVCNYRFHELEKEKDYFLRNDIVLLAVYESSPENVKMLRDTNQFYQILVPDPSGILFDLYRVEKSKAKINKGALHGARRKANEGNKLFSKKIKQDGNDARVPADFIIDENGNIVTAYYGKYLGDHLTIEFLKAKFNP